MEGADDPQEADQPQPPTPVVQIQGPDVPEPIQAAIAAADTREEKVNVAFTYLKSLPNVRFGARAGDTTAAIEAADAKEDKLAIAFGYLKSLEKQGLISFGAHRSDVFDTRLRNVRDYEAITGNELLPPDFY